MNWNERIESLQEREKLLIRLIVIKARSPEKFEEFATERGYKKVHGVWDFKKHSTKQLRQLKTEWERKYGD